MPAHQPSDPPTTPRITPMMIALMSKTALTNPGDASAVRSPNRCVRLGESPARMSVSAPGPAPHELHPQRGPESRAERCDESDEKHDDGTDAAEEPDDQRS